MWVGRGLTDAVTCLGIQHPYLVLCRQDDMTSLAIRPAAPRRHPSSAQTMLRQLLQRRNRSGSGYAGTNDITHASGLIVDTGNELDKTSGQADNSL